VVLRHAGALYWRFVNSVLTRDTPIGRKAAAGFERRGAPLIGISMRILERAGVTRLKRIESVSNGLPVTQDGRIISVKTVIWATGYRSDLSWIDGVQLQPDGWPEHARGVVESAPGLYVLGAPFQYALTSGLLGGIGRDAAYLAARITQSAAQPRPVSVPSGRGHKHG
jgi:putative flavoprotein involved in K+ transport